MTKYSFNNDNPQSVRRAITENDERIRKGGTYHEFAASEAGASGGRFAARERSTVVGSGPVAYPQLPENSWGNQGAAVPPEPSLGVAIDEMETVGTHAEIDQSLQSLREMRDEAGPPPASLPDSPNDEGRAPLGSLLADVSRRPRRLSRHRKG
jgi:hypothetical protein